ncbi:DEAD/DEAH box helicase family protein [Gordonia sp. NPDC003424]
MDWADDDFNIGVERLTRHHKAKEHQQLAINKVFAVFAIGNDRGNLIMARGTGKTFAALRIAERTATANGGRARTVFCVPSISLQHMHPDIGAPISDSGRFMTGTRNTR